MSDVKFTSMHLVIFVEIYSSGRLVITPASPVAEDCIKELIAQGLVYKIDNDPMLHITEYGEVKFQQLLLALKLLGAI